MSHFSRYLIKLIFLADLILAVSILAEQKLAGVDAFFYTIVGRMTGHDAGDYAQLHTPGEPVHTETILLREHRRTYPTVNYVIWETDGREDLPTLPRPKIQELATILNCLASKVGAEAVSVSTPMVWEDSQDEMAHHMLARALQGIRHTCFGQPARNAAQAEAMPNHLKPAIIPPSQVEGNPAGLPYANKPLPGSAPMADPASVLWAPDYVEDEPTVSGNYRVQGLTCPLLMRWKGDILPTLPLRLALAQLGLTPADVHVRLGKSIRIGQRLLPLDERGRTPLGASVVHPLSLGDVLSTPPDSPRPGKSVILARAFTPEQSAERAKLQAATLSLLLSKDADVYMPTERAKGNMLMEQNALQATLAGKLIIAALIIAALIWLPMFEIERQFIALAAMAAILLILFMVWYSFGIWMSVSACTICWLMLTGSVWLLSGSLRR